MTKPVFFFMLDGLRPDAIAVTKSQHLHGLMARGSHTLAATSVMPSITLPCHTSIFHSVPPQRHGVTTNVFQPMARPLPGLIDVAHSHGLNCMAIYNWEPLRDIARPETLQASFCVRTAYQADGDDILAAEAVRLVGAYKPDFTFIYLGTIDTAGHAYGWMSARYLEQVERVDIQLGLILSALPGDSNIVVQADHGGHDRNHGTDALEDMTIPWLAAGPSIRVAHVIKSAVSLLDTAPTIARMLDIPANREWEGHSVDEIFLT